MVVYLVGGRDVNLVPTVDEVSAVNGGDPVQVAVAVNVDDHVADYEDVHVEVAGPSPLSNPR